MIKLSLDDKDLNDEPGLLVSGYSTLARTRSLTHSFGLSLGT